MILTYHSLSSVLTFSYFVLVTSKKQPVTPHYRCHTTGFFSRNFLFFSGKAVQGKQTLGNLAESQWGNLLHDFFLNPLDMSSAVSYKAPEAVNHPLSLHSSPHAQQGF